MIYSFSQKCLWGLYKYFVNPFIKHEFNSCGKEVIIGRRFHANPPHNITIGDHTSIGDKAYFLCTRAPITIGSHVLFGPGVTIITGNHRTDLTDIYMDEITDKDKRPEDDLPVVIEDDVWIGANVTILKGVTVHTGSVIAAGAVVVNDVPTYSIVGGVPARVLKSRKSN